jgi:hypothetical protein
VAQVCCESQKQELARESIHLGVQDVGASVINLLIDVPGTMRDFESPVQLHAEALGQLRTVFEMPETRARR